MAANIFDSGVQPFQINTFRSGILHCSVLFTLNVSPSCVTVVIAAIAYSFSRCIFRPIVSRLFLQMEEIT